ncbi:MAG: acetylxylan esterase [Planctomycetales bacterium]|nr:acetylxylan esterase [Planctomycetales bacterium]
MALSPAARADGPQRILPAGEKPNDARLKPLKDLDGYFPFQPYESNDEWAKRAERVRTQIRVSQGIWPEPTKTPLNAVVHGKKDFGDYTIEKVYFESMPGFYVTGSLYRPKNASGRVPAVLCPHGHWANGRFYDDGEAAVKQKIAVGAEQFLNGGRSPLQARCVQLARMGCVVFHYDMLGYADSQQLSFELVHRFAKQRPEANSREHWGFFSPQAESRVQSVMGLQTWNSVRALDFVTSLDDVDPTRLAVTGASGGGTQTFLIAAIDPRLAVAFPAVMVSTAMQGGCTCENSSLLRVGTGNIEFAALFAPKPLGMTAADDWTREMTAKGYPELEEHYRRHGALDNLMMISQIRFPHNYNQVSRLAMYAWLNHHLELNQPEPITESDYDRQTAEQLTVFDDQHPRPAGGPDFERALLRWWDADAQLQMAALRPRDAASLRAYRHVVGNAIDVLIGRSLPDGGDVEYEQTDKVDEGAYLRMVGLLRNKRQGEELPIEFLFPKSWESSVAIWVDSQGKAGLYGEDGKLRGEVQRLLDNGVSVVGVDLLMQGEFLADGESAEPTRKVGNPREAAAYTFGYSSSLFAQRVHDILSTVAFVRSHEYQPKQVAVIGLGEAGPLVAAARAQARDAINVAVVDTRGFRFADVDDIHGANFLPGGAKYDDLLGMLAVSAGDRLFLAGETADSASLVRDAYAAAGANDALQLDASEPESRSAAAIDWLLKQFAP